MFKKKLASYSISILLGMQSLLCFAETNYATNSTISASSLAGTLALSNVADGNLDTSWGSGAHPPAWVEFDFGSGKKVTMIKAIVDQKPSSNTVHNVYLDDVLSHTWAGFTEKGNELTWTLPAEISAQKVRIETTVSESWVGWKEISILGPDAAPTPNPNNQVNNSFAVLEVNTDITLTLAEFISPQQNIFLRAFFAYLGTNANNEHLWKLKHYNELENIHGYTNIPTVEENKNLFIKINSISTGTGKTTYWAELEFIGDNGTPNALVWKLKNFGLN